MAVSLKDIRSDLLLILAKSTQSRNFRIHEDHIDYKIHEKRARGIHEESKRNNDMVDPNWLSEMGTMDITLITTADDPSVPQECKEVGKIVIPQVVSLTENKGVYRVAGSSKKGNWHQKELPLFWDTFSLEGHIAQKFRWYAAVGTSLYLSNPERQANVTLVLYNPLDGFILRTANVTDLEIGEQYVVVGGNITHNGIVYYTDGTFTAVNTVFTGGGKVQYVNKKRRVNENDPYPIGAIADYVIMKILTQEFKIEASEIGDIRNDNRDALLALQKQS